MKRRQFISTASMAAAATMLHPRWAYGSVISTSADTQAAAAGDLKMLWPSAREQFFPKSLLGGPGFSFFYEGKPAIATGVSEKDHGESREAVFQYASGVEVLRSATPLPGANAVEYTLRLRNTSSQRSATISSLNTMDVSFAANVISGSYVVSSGGGGFDGTYPPQAFAIRRHYFNPTLPSDGAVTLTTDSGRSSNVDLPFYFIHNDEARAGIFVGMGWTGQWIATIDANNPVEGGPSGGLHLRGGIPGIDLQLEPGEELPGPRILIGAYQGSVADGSNALRRLIRTHYTPKLDRSEASVIATYDSWWNILEKYDEALLQPVAEAAASLGQEYFLLDAAWFVGCNGPEGFSGGVGNWEQVDSTKFPSGLEHFSKYVRSKNLKFGLWFEPERVHRTSALATQHRDWVIWRDDTPYGLLDYSREEVRSWVREMISRYITQLDIEYIRHDFNFDPLPYWNGKDAAGRRGISQIRHIEGFYSVIDWIRERHPKTLLECCAGGGRRIDLETARRFHTYWISDDTIDPEVDRFHLQGIHHFLPGNYTYVQYTLPVPSQKQFQPKDMDYLSLFAGAMGLGGRVDLWPEQQKERFRTIEKLHKQLRPFLMEDYYPILPQPLDLHGWAGWQFHDPKGGSGFIQLFRQESPVATMSVPLYGLDAGNTYTFRDPLGSKSVKLSGTAAMKDGFPIQLDAMSSQIFVYERAKPD